MELIREYLIQNWSVILILLAFAVMLKVTVFLDQKVIKKMYILVIVLFAFSMTVFFEYYLEEQNVLENVRIVLMMIRYSTTPFIIAMVLFTLIKKANVYYCAGDCLRHNKFHFNSYRYCVLNRREWSAHKRTFGISSIYCSWRLLRGINLAFIYPQQ